MNKIIALSSSRCSFVILVISVSRTASSVVVVIVMYFHRSPLLIQACPQCSFRHVLNALKLCHSHGRGWNPLSSHSSGKKIRFDLQRRELLSEQALDVDPGGVLCPPSINKLQEGEARPTFRKRGVFGASATNNNLPNSVLFLIFDVVSHCPPTQAGHLKR